MTYLQSVGSFLDTKTAMIYPAFENDTPDLDNGVSLTEDIIPGEWLENLDENDRKIVEKFLS